jgi:hypothetical protein
MLHKKNAKLKYVVDCVQGFVKIHLFRKVKFITKQKMLEEVMEVVECSCGERIPYSNVENT